MAFTVSDFTLSCQTNSKMSPFSPQLKCPLFSCPTVLHREVAASFPGMVERGLVSGFFELSLFGPLDGGVNAFLIVEGNGRLTFCKHLVREHPALVEDGHAAAKGFTDGDLAVSHRIARSAVLNLVLAVLELQGEVLRQDAGVMQAQDQRQLPRRMYHRAVGVVRVLRRDGKAPVVVLDKCRQEGIGRIDVVDALQTHLLDQAVLEGLVGSFHAPLGLWGVGVDRRDIESLEGTGELGEFSVVLGMIDPENAARKMLRLSEYRATGRPWRLRYVRSVSI